MNLRGRIEKIVDSRVASYTAPERLEMCGVEILIKNETEKWLDIFEEWLPRYDIVGWLDGLTSIRVESGSVEGEFTGRYVNCHIDLEPDAIVHTLTHEVIHHAHIHQRGFTRGKMPMTEIAIRYHVGDYAATNIGEAIAETGMKIAHGAEYPPSVTDYYEKYDGPEEVYEIREMCRAA